MLNRVNRRVTAGFMAIAMFLSTLIMPTQAAFASEGMSSNGNNGTYQPVWCQQTGKAWAAKLGAKPSENADRVWLTSLPEGFSEPDIEIRTAENGLKQVYAHNASKLKSLDPACNDQVTATTLEDEQEDEADSPDQTVEENTPQDPVTTENLTTPEDTEDSTPENSEAETDQQVTRAYTPPPTPACVENVTTGADGKIKAENDTIIFERYIDRWVDNARIGAATAIELYEATLTITYDGPVGTPTINGGVTPGWGHFKEQEYLRKAYVPSVVTDIPNSITQGESIPMRIADVMSRASINGNTVTIDISYMPRGSSFSFNAGSGVIGAVLSAKQKVNCPLTIEKVDQDGNLLPGGKFAGMSCTRFDGEIDWTCISLDDYAWFREGMTNDATTYDYFSNEIEQESPIAESCSDPRLMHIVLIREIKAPAGYIGTEGWSSLCQTIHGWIADTSNDSPVETEDALLNIGHLADGVTTDGSTVKITNLLIGRGGGTVPEVPKPTPPVSPTNPVTTPVTVQPVRVTSQTGTLPETGSSLINLVTMIIAVLAIYGAVYFAQVRRHYEG